MESLLREYNSKIEATRQSYEAMIQSQREEIKSQATAIRNIEVLMNQIAEERKNETQGPLLSATEVPRGNSEEQCQGETLLSGKSIPQRIMRGRKETCNP